MGDALIPRCARSRSSVASCAKPPPVPPRVYAGRDHDQVADPLGERERFVHGVRGDGLGDRLADLEEQLLERLAILGLPGSP